MHHPNETCESWRPFRPYLFDSSVYEQFCVPDGMEQQYTCPLTFCKERRCNLKPMLQAYTTIQPTIPLLSSMSR